MSAESVASTLNDAVASLLGVTPLAHARARGFTEMVRILEGAGGR